MIRIRRVSGESMLPALRPGTIVVGTRLWQHYRPGDVVIAEYGGREIIKRIADIRIAASGRWAKTELYITGDNQTASTDSRSYGWLPVTTLKGKVIWPRRLHRNSNL